MAYNISHIPMAGLNPSLNPLDLGSPTEAASKNTLMILGGKIGLEATEDKIIIVLDKFKSGYECKTCSGEGSIKACPCVTSGTPGVNAMGRVCKYCQGDPVSVIPKGNNDVTCPDCKGAGSTIIIPEAFKSLPTSGVIVSVGELCTKRKIGDRVLFGAHTGYFLPFKGNIKIRCMRETEPLCLIYAVDTNEMALGDFIDENKIGE